jgi:hypothetical protein
MAGVDVEPVIGVSEPSAKSSIFAIQAGRPGLCIVPAQIEIVEKHEFCIDATGAVVGIGRATGFFVRGDKSDIGAWRERAF